MSRTEDFGRLREEIQAGHRDRREFVADLSMEFVANLRRTVAGLRKGFMDENRAAHAAWFGPTRAEKTETARMKEAAKAVLLKEAAAQAARMKEEAKAALLKEAAAQAVRMKEAAVKAALLKEAAVKAVLVRVTKKPSKKGRGR